MASAIMRAGLAATSFLLALGLSGGIVQVTAQEKAPPAGTPSPAPMPEFEIYLASLSGAGPTLAVGAPKNISNHQGYDNQPKFDRDDRSIVFTRGESPTRTDIFRFDLATSQLTPVKETSESEYSATPMPDGSGYGVIRVELDGVQRLWRLNPTKDKADEVLVPTIKPIGYFAFPEPQVVAAFVLGNPPTLQLIDLATQEAKVIASNVGRSLQKVPGRKSASFVHKISAEEWMIKEVDARGAVKDIVRTPKGREDYAWLGDGTLVISAGTKILALKPGVDGDWRQIADFEALGLKDLTRLATNARGDQIAIVASPK